MMKALSTNLLIILSLMLILTSCATIFSSSVSSLYIKTNPKKAAITIINRNGKEVFSGTSPATVALPIGAGFFSRADYKVKISAPGYEEKTVRVRYKLNGWYWGNILIGGLIGMLVIDPATGAIWKVKDPVINETLVS